MRSLLLPMVLCLPLPLQAAEDGGPLAVQILTPRSGAQVSEALIRARYRVDLTGLAGLPGALQTRWFVNGKLASSFRDARLESVGSAPAGSGAEGEASLLIPEGPVVLKLQVSAAGRGGQALVHFVRPVRAHAAASQLRLVSIGVAAYREPGLVLDYPAKDARDLARELVHQRGRAFSSLQQRVLTDASATRRAILDSLAWLGQTTQEDDLAILFLAGHGVEEAGRYFFVPVDGQLGEPTSLISGEELQGALAQSAGQVLVLLDTCHAGAAFQGALRAARPAALGHRLEANGQVTVLAATQRDQLAVERTSLQNGAFTRALIDGLRGAADRDHDGALIETELEDFLGRRVPALSDGNQRPTIFKLHAPTHLLLALVPLPLWKRPWFWAVLGGAAAGIATGAALAVRYPPDPGGTRTLVWSMGFQR